MKSHKDSSDDFPSATDSVAAASTSGKTQKATKRKVKRTSKSRKATTPTDEPPEDIPDGFFCPCVSQNHPEGCHTVLYIDPRHPQSRAARSMCWDCWHRCNGKTDGWSTAFFSLEQVVAETDKQKDIRHRVPPTTAPYSETSRYSPSRDFGTHPTSLKRKSSSPPLGASQGLVRLHTSTPPRYPFAPPLESEHYAPRPSPYAPGPSPQLTSNNYGKHPGGEARRVATPSALSRFDMPAESFDINSTSAYALPSTFITPKQQLTSLPAEPTPVFDPLDYARGVSQSCDGNQAQRHATHVQSSTPRSTTPAQSPYATLRPNYTFPSQLIMPHHHFTERTASRLTSTTPSEHGSDASSYQDESQPVFNPSSRPSSRRPPSESLTEEASPITNVPSSSKTSRAPKLRRLAPRPEKAPAASPDPSVYSGAASLEFPSLGNRSWSHDPSPSSDFNPMARDYPPPSSGA